MGLRELLGYCMGCHKIRIDDENDRWLSRDENPEYYDMLMKNYEGKLSHSFCNPCSENYFEEESKSQIFNQSSQ